MQLIVLGSGTSVPHPGRCSPSYWLETTAGTILLDAGPDAAHRMAHEKVDWPNLDAIWVSHFHLDHFGGLPTLLFGFRWSPQTQARTKPLRVVGPKGLHGLLETINNANNYKLLQQPFPVEIVEVETDHPFDFLPQLIGNAVSTPHTTESLALRLTDRAMKTLVYTSDTGFTEDLFTFAAAPNLLLLECSFRRNKSVQTHLQLSEAMQIAQACNPKRLVLTHLYPEWDEFNLVAEANSFWTGETIEATDGLRLII
ncbi:MAG: hypothetical protein C5B55_04205 [Blastocatellia bacterium]|nr:MAG: hypothetical protein C5B55_04205 [Blastocatellia bacterium]